ncbi:MAG: M23 family metallopeptidase [Fibromonadaceae bacterium]|jgi:hypothetical protein|nr:M23 family metallopeptidase [Fibromonadaceae bacterium]
MSLAFAKPYQPMGRTAYLTSSFGESRGARYHAGIDFSTNREEGWPVLAPSDGMVEFAVRNPFGYGRYIRFKAKDDHIWLFAHLSEFNRRIDALIRDEMLKKEKASVQLWLKVNFKKGDTLGYSGSTGIGHPHLHVERRTPNRKFILNPCKHMECSDTIAPFILDAAPFDSGFAIKIVDYSREPFDNPMSIYSLEVFQNNKRIFSKKYDSIALANMSDVTNDLLRVEDASPGSWHFINVKVKNPKIQVVARDFANNVSRKELTIRPHPLKLRAELPKEVTLDTVPPALGHVYLKMDYAEKMQCRIPVLSAFGLDFDSVDFRDKDNKWIIFDFDSDPKELFIEQRDFDFSDFLKLKLCDKAKSCIEVEVKCSG